jgi:hypothetical protein
MTNVSEEQKIIFMEGEEVRVLRGIIDHEDEFFIYVKRNDGERRIGKQFIIKTEPEKNRRVDDAT